MNRKEARECAFKILFANEFSKENTAMALWEKEMEQGNYKNNEYVATLLTLTDTHKDEIEQSMQEYAVGWKINRVSAVSRAILKLAIAEMFYMPEIPALVSLNEAVELSKSYDNEKAYGFVNGVLNAAMKDARCIENRE